MWSGTAKPFVGSEAEFDLGAPIALGPDNIIDILHLVLMI